MTTGIKEIDDYLETVRAVQFYDDIEDLITASIYEEGDQQFIDIVQKETGYIDLEDRNYDRTVVLNLVKINKFIKISYTQLMDEVIDLKFEKQVFPHPKKVIKYL